MLNIDATNAVYVNPFYREILHANYLRLADGERDAFVASARRALSTLSEETEGRLLRWTWREQLAGSWFAGLKGWTQFTELIGELLAASPTCYAGQGHCFALARFATEESADYLKRFLDTWLPQIESYYNQQWALSALLWLDRVNGTEEAQVYLQPDGLWERFTADKRRHGAWDIARHERHFADALLFCARWFDAAPTAPNELLRSAEPTVRTGHF